MSDIVEQLRNWPAADGKDGLAAHFVEGLMSESADEIERLRATITDLTVALREIANLRYDNTSAAGIAQSALARARGRDGMEIKIIHGIVRGEGGQGGTE